MNTPASRAYYESFKSFEFNEEIYEWEGFFDDLKKRFKKLLKIKDKRSFTQSSSFVGKVTYIRDGQRMEINLGGTKYNFCNVPESIFDAFEGASSKGAFFGRSIKGQFDC